MKVPRLFRPTTLRGLMLRIALVAVLMAGAINVYHHSVIIEPAFSNNHSILWIDYGRVQIRIGGTSWLDAYQFQILCWPSQEWSWRVPGHQRQP